MRFVAAALATLLLSACFYSDGRLLPSDEAVTPFADGAIFELRPSERNGERDGKIQLTLDGQTYQVRSIGGDEDARLRMTFAEIPQTPERDYVAQIAGPDEGTHGYEYLFLWPDGEDRYLLQVQAVARDNAGRPTFDPCAGVLFGCEFVSWEELLKHYLDAVYPVLSVGRRPSNYTEMIPVEAPALE